MGLVRGVNHAAASMRIPVEALDVERSVTGYAGAGQRRESQDVCHHSSTLAVRLMSHLAVPTLPAPCGRAAA